jgi:hypothetical protein
MKFTFGFSQCYWLIISTAKQLEFALEHLRMTQQDPSVYVEALAEGKVICLNEAGGYHPEYLNQTDKTQFIEQTSSRFPTKADRVEVMKTELLADINAIETELGQPLTKELILA